MRPASALKWAGLAVVVLVAVAVAVLFFVDAGDYREEIAEEFRKATGRDLAIGGDIDVAVSLHPVIVVERVSIANAGWGSRPAMAVLERAEAEVELLPLLAGNVRVTRLILVEPDILLERNADGLPNWRGAPSPGAGSGVSVRAADEAGRKGKADSEASFAPVFDHVEIRRGRLTYRDARTGGQMRLDLSGQVAFSLAGPRPRIAGTLAASAIDLDGQPSKPAGNGSDAVAAGSGAKPEGSRPARLFPDEPLPMDRLKAVDLDLTLSIGALSGYPVPVNAVEARIRLEDGALAVEPFEATVAGSPVEGALRLDARRAVPGFRLAARADGFDFGRLLTEAGVADLFEGPATARIDLSGAGRSVAMLMAGLDGDIRIVAGAGRLKTRALNGTVGGALLGAVFSGRRDWTVVNCAAASIGVEKGRAAVRAALIDTEYSTVAARGSANLAAETLDLAIEPRAKAAALDIAVPLHIRGRIAQPNFRLDAGAALEKLGGGASPFPPAAIAGLGELGAADCLNAAAAPPAGAARPEDAARELRDNLKGTVKTLGRSLKGLFRNRQN